MKGIHALHFLKLPSMAIFPWGFDHFISEIADERQHLENPAALLPTSVAAKPPLRFQSLPNLQFSHPQLTYTKKQKRQQLYIC